MSKKSKKQRSRNVSETFEDWDGPIPPKELWLLIDLANGRDGRVNYAFWFREKQKALAHKCKHEITPSYTDLAGPYRYVLKTNDDVGDPT